MRRYSEAPGLGPALLSFFIFGCASSPDSSTPLDLHSKPKPITYSDRNLEVFGLSQMEILTLDSEGRISLKGNCTEEGAQIKIQFGAWSWTGSCQRGEFQVLEQPPHSFSFGFHSVALEQVGLEKTISTSFQAFFTPHLSPPPHFEVSGWGDFPYLDAEGNATRDIRKARTVRWEEFETYRSAMRIDRIHFGLGKKGVDRGNNRRLLVDHILPHLNSNPRVKMRMTGDLGRPVGPAGILSLPASAPECSSFNGPCVFDPTYGRSARTQNELIAMIQNDALTELEEFLGWKRQFPNALDDQYLQDDTLAGSKRFTFLDPDFFQRACQRGKSLNPNFKFDIVLYCTSNPAGSNNIDRYSKFLCPPDTPSCDPAQQLNLNLPTWQIDAMKRYMDHFPAIRECVDDVHLWYQAATSGPEGRIDAWTSSDRRHIEQCIDHAKTDLQKDVTLGIYFAGYNSVSFFQKIQMLEQGLKMASQKPIEGFSLLLYPRPWLEDAANPGAALDQELFDYLQKRWKGLFP